ncbi:MAG: ATP-binding cassette domain-containing protein [Acidiferrobacteraceae bacterium]
MPILRIDDVSLRYGHHPLLEHAALEINARERICLIGRNGEGKSSLLRLVAGETPPDSGTIWRAPSLRMAYLPQEAVWNLDRSVYEMVADGLAETSALLVRYEQTVAALAARPAPAMIAALADLQQRLEMADGWRLRQRIDSVLSRLGLDAGQRLRELSGGWRRRVLLARALVCDPELLLLDEPTNHLDIDGIEWLEGFLAEFSGAVLFVTHDRAFLEGLAPRIVELDRGHLVSWPGHFADYLRRKAHQLATEAGQAALFDKQLSQEEAWIRQGVKARRTRNEGRVRALEAMREQRRVRRAQIGQAALRLDSGEASGQLVFETDSVDCRYGDTTVIRNFSVRIERGDRVGIIGPNGAGKSSLLRLLLGDLVPDRGLVRHGARIRTAYFDQERAQLDADATVMDSVAEGRSMITIGERTQHVAGYLRGFLFPQERLASPVRMLSGGERNRLLLARLFAKPANVLVLDEPTNDLDVETLELLEELLIEFEGTLLLVSHDRMFLDHTVTSTLVFEGAGRITEYAGGYSDWLRQRPVLKLRLAPVKDCPVPERPVPPQKVARRRSYKEQHELEVIPHAIETLEAEQRALQDQLSSGALYRGAPAEAIAAEQRLRDIAQALAAYYVRWEALES